MIVGTGIDVIEIERVARALARHGDRFAARVFSRAERAECARFVRPAPQYALRFAAKEAVMKAVGTGWAKGVRWVDIEVVASSAGRAAGVQLHGRVAQIARQQGAVRVHLALSRTRSHALAVVVCEAGAA